MVDTTVWMTEREREASAEVLTVWSGYTSDGVFQKRFPAFRGNRAKCLEYLKGNFGSAVRGDLDLVNASGRLVSFVL